IMKLKEVQRCALELPDSERATLAAELLISLPVVLVDEDDGIVEARRRSKELDEDPAAGCSWDEIKRALAR
ncbi:MAG: addiction module protein, partial [Verrucomicrobia bacterium]|nr:addiction module protein [Verrucomicrobiota bacterium]